MKEELESMQHDKAWEYWIQQKDSNQLFCKWFKKLKTLRESDNYKVRLVSKGYMQCEVMEYIEINIFIQMILLDLLWHQLCILTQYYT